MNRAGLSRCIECGKDVQAVTKYRLCSDCCSWDDQLIRDIDSIKGWFEQGRDHKDWYLTKTEFLDGIKMCERMEEYVKLVKERFDAKRNRNDTL